MREASKVALSTARAEAAESRDERPDPLDLPDRPAQRTVALTALPARLGAPDEGRARRQPLPSPREGRPSPCAREEPQQRRFFEEDAPHRLARIGVRLRDGSRRLALGRLREPKLEEPGVSLLRRNPRELRVPLRRAKWEQRCSRHPTERARRPPETNDERALRLSLPLRLKRRHPPRPAIRRPVRYQPDSGIRLSDDPGTGRAPGLAVTRVGPAIPGGGGAGAGAVSTS